MSATTVYFRLTALATAVLTLSGNTYSQQKNADLEIEEVVVTGIRAAIERSIEDKKKAQNIIDTINAEDIGKTTDQNIAEALSRVTGVSLQTRDGEGTTITVRGAGSNQNNISLNGVTLTSTDFNQSVDLSAFSADILSKLEVVKTPSADHDEGALGANINLVTTRPLETSKNIRAITLQGRRNNFAEQNDHKLSLSFSQKLLDDSLGFILTAFDETNTYRKDQFLVDDYVASHVGQSAVRIARDQNDNIISDVNGIVATGMSYQLHQNESDRKGFTFGIQWQPDDSTDIFLDVSKSKQSLVQNWHAVKTRRPNDPNFVEGRNTVTTQPAAPYTDPQEDWYTIDTRTRTFTKYLNRSGFGDLLRSEGGSDVDNDIASLKLSHDISDAFTIEFGVAYSRSKSESKPNGFLTMQNGNTVNGHVLYNAGPVGTPGGIEPIGYDCSSGSCNLEFGEGFANLGENILNYTDENGVPRVAWWDNSATTGFNPQDIEAQHIGFLSETDQSVDDKNTSFNIDLDWHIDTFGITTLEFGTKVSMRDKAVDNQIFDFGNVTRSTIVRDDKGNPVGRPGEGLIDIRAPLLLSGETFPYDDFMHTLGYGRDNATIGWDLVSARRALNLVLDNENTIRNTDATETRSSELTSNAGYIKANFSFFDERLTGDLGIRYVETEVEAFGSSGVNFFSHTAFDLEREFDLVTLSQLRNQDLPPCPTVIPANGIMPADYENKYQRVDGLGWDTSSGADPSGWTPIADVGPCHEQELVRLEAYYDALAADPNFSGVRPDVNWVTMWRHADISTTHVYGWGNNFGLDWEVDANGNNIYTDRNRVDRTLSSTPAYDKHRYSNVLPSLNVNYTFNNKLIGRLALSKTMARPELDLLRPGFRVAETAWRPRSTNTVTLFDTDLEPLESNNFDIALEWYFNESSILSAAFFHKDMKNFSTIESTRGYIRDIRNIWNGENFTSDDLVLVANDDTENNYGLNGCMPNRTVADFAFDSDPENWSNDYRVLCGIYNINAVRNGAGATISGIELQYSQTYDFLPGYFLSGLGTSLNYTYQDSEYELETSSIDASQEIAPLPVADTPEHTYNATAFWQQGGHQIRLSFRGTSDSLVGIDGNTGLSGRTWNQGTLWNEGRDTLDLSATYQLNDIASITFQAINLTDSESRTYFTSRTLSVIPTFDDTGQLTGYQPWNEGDPLDGGATKSRTVSRFKTGIIYRLGIRLDF
ncbi:TonB-dependent receptor [Agarilytica rhodophyticola]|uniref:TonB-dependent receptor n=1 Tax=Agarilytica rhodophyticola TaxID=1737490 RepID=UPI000B345816|nr:TonB-dependent receptor [Agarilytica rhodophyticola]